MRIRRFGNATLYGLLGFIVVIAGCSHKVAVKPPAAPPAANPPAQPTITLDASRTNIDQGQSVNLRWSATNATSVSVTPEPGSVAAQGSSDRHAAPIHYLHRDGDRPGRFSHRQHSCDGHGGLGGCARFRRPLGRGDVHEGSARRILRL